MKTFIFKYNPSGSFDRMLVNMEQAIKTGKPNIQPKNVVMSNSLGAIYRSITPSRLAIFTCLIEKKPKNITELANLLRRDYAEVHKDVLVLEGLEIIKLKKVGKETQPVALYDKITFDFSLAKRPAKISRPISV